MKVTAIITTIVGVVTLAGALACGASDTPPAAPAHEPTARPTITGLNPIATPSDTPAPITPIPGNTPVANGGQPNPNAPAATPTSTPALPTATMPASAGRIQTVAEPTPTPTPTPTPVPTPTPAPVLASYSAQFSQQDYDALAANLPYPPVGRPIPPLGWETATERHPINKGCYHYGQDETLFPHTGAPVIDYTADGILGSPSHQSHRQYAESALASDVAGEYHALVGEHYPEWEHARNEVDNGTYWRSSTRLPTRTECIQFEVMHPRLPVVRYLWEASIQNPDWRSSDPAKDRYRHWRLHGYFILEDEPDPAYPTERKLYTVRPLGPVSVSPPEMCDRWLRYGANVTYPCP